jgi:hypothetical protein
MVDKAPLRLESSLFLVVFMILIGDYIWLYSCKL